MDTSTLVDPQDVVGWRLVLIYTRTSLTHYYLESSGQAAYMDTHLLSWPWPPPPNKVKCWRAPGGDEILYLLIEFHYGRAYNEC